MCGKAERQSLPGQAAVDGDCASLPHSATSCAIAATQAWRRKSHQSIHRFACWRFHYPAHSRSPVPERRLASACAGKTRTGIRDPARTRFVSLPANSLLIPRLPCDAMKMTSHSNWTAARTLSPAGSSERVTTVSQGTPAAQAASNRRSVFCCADRSPSCSYCLA